MEILQSSLGRLKMIRRSRPKYLKEEFLYNNELVKTESGLYFNRGSAALYFLLKFLKKNMNKNLTVCVQSFNCRTVADAALQVEGVKLLLADVKKKDFSISLEFLKNNYKSIDILLLLHYQGLINTETNEIILFCKEKNIIVIEDLAHINESDYNLIGDFGIYSYSFDKPYTCFRGGSLVLSQNSTKLYYKNILNDYKKLEVEKNENEELDLKKLHYLFLASTQGNYNKTTDLLLDLNMFFQIFNTQTLIFISKLPLSKYIIKIILKLKRFIIKDKLPSYKPFRLNNKKISILLQQKKNYADNKDDFLKSQNLLLEKLLNFLNLDINEPVTWNRLSFISDETIKGLENHEFGNFNWPVPLNEYYKSNKNVQLIGKYENTKYLCKNIINFPVWNFKNLGY